MPASPPSGGPRPFRLRAVLFDFDGTLTQPDALDFAAFKHEIGCPPGDFVLEWIEALPPGRRRDDALAALERFELAGARTAAPNDGAEAVIGSLRALGLPVGILTRNGRPAVEESLSRFTAVSLSDFDVIVTRDDGLAPKPAADGVLHAAGAMGAAPEETLVVGDYLLDMQAGRAAGAVTAYLTNAPADAADPATRDEAAAIADVDELACSDGSECDFILSRLDHLRDVVRLGLPLPAGKLPNDLLGGYIRSLAAGDPALLVPPGVGQDVAALDLQGAEVMVAHGDPITLGGGELGRSAVLVNANDIATSGVRPRWMLATVLLPPGTTPSQALATLGDIAAAAAEDDIVVAGGHTEVSTAVVRPVVSLTMLGTLSRAELRDKRSVRPRDRVVLTKALAMEGTALLADELDRRLRALGMTDAELAGCRSLLMEASVVKEAGIAAGLEAVRAMHDVTEGGLATALRELAAATMHGVVVHRDKVPVATLTRRVCDLLGADPLGLIASGSLLICCAPDGVARLLEALRDGGVEAREIGEFGEPGAGVAALERGRPAPWPEFAADEAARLLAQ